MTITIRCGDVVEQLKQIKENSVDAVIVDPPYNLGMDEWDKWPSNEDFGVWCCTWAKQAFRVLRPGGSILSFSSNRTYHWMAWGIESAGFVTRDMIEWVYWTTMPRKNNLKSCHEPIYYGTKGTKNITVNIEECRVPLTAGIKKEFDHLLLPNMPTGKHPGRGAYSGTGAAKKYGRAVDDKPYQMNEAGRHPYNIVTENIADEITYPINVLDVKKPKSRRDIIAGHQTQKPVPVMKWLVSLVTEPGDLIVDCFAGTGTTGVATLELGRNVILIDREQEYVDLMNERFQEISSSGLLEY